MRRSFGRSVRTQRFHKTNNSTGIQRAVVYGIIILMLFGVVAGSIYASFLDEASYDAVKSCITGFFSSFDKTGINAKSTLIDSFYKYFRIIAAVWISGFFAPGLIAVICLLLFKSFAYGFTTAALVKYFGFYGFVIGFSSYVPQNLFFLPAMLFASHKAIMLIHSNITDSAAVKSDGKNLAEYCLVFLTGILCCACAALTETYLTPVFIEYIKPV